MKNLFIICLIIKIRNWPSLYNNHYNHYSYIYDLLDIYSSYLFLPFKKLQKQEADYWKRGLGYPVSTTHLPPDHLHHVDVAERDHHTRSDQNVAGQEVEVQHSLPVRSVSYTPALQLFYSVRVHNAHLLCGLRKG